jgi:hypothetical protein
VQKPTSTNDKESKEPAAVPRDGPAAPTKESKLKRVSFAAKLPRYKPNRRRTLPCAGPWTWGRVFDRPYDCKRWLQDPVRGVGQKCKQDRKHLRFVMRALRDADCAAAGCGEGYCGSCRDPFEPEQPAPVWVRLHTHRRWCPTSLRLPPEHDLGPVLVANRPYLM